MEFNTAAFFTELEDSDVQGFAVIGVAENFDGGPAYRMAEKWNRPERDGGPTWLTYWIPESQLLDRVESGKCKYAKQMSDKQLQGVINLADVRVQEAPTATA